MDKQLRKKLKSVKTDRRDTKINAFVGDLRTGDVKVPNQLNTIYATIAYNGQVVRVRNNKVPTRFRLPIIIGYPDGSTTLQVISEREGVYPNLNLPILPDHSHTWGESDNPSYIRKEQLLELAPVAVGGLLVRVNAGTYCIDGVYYSKYASEHDMAAYVPATGAVWVSVSVDMDGAFTYTTSTAYAVRSDLVASLIPAVPADENFLFAVRLVQGQTSILQSATDTDIFDPRGIDRNTTTTGGGGGASPDISWVIDGAIDAESPADVPIVCTQDFDTQYIYAYLEGTGSSGSTTIDIKKNGTSLFVTLPEIAYNDANGWVKVDLAESFAEGDLLQLDIVSAATGAYGLRVSLVKTSTETFAIQVTDGTTTVSTKTIQVEGAIVTDEGGDVAKITIQGGVTVTDGTTTVSSATTIDFSGATVSDSGGGTASVSVSGGAGGGLFEDILAALAANTDPIDTVIENGDFVSLIFYGSHNAATWKAATSTYTVPTGKKLIIMQLLPSGAVMNDTSNRRARVYNSTDSVVIVDHVEFYSNASPQFFWSGDLSTPSAFKTVAAGKTARMEIWNGDSNRRAIGALVIGKLMDA